MWSTRSVVQAVVELVGNSKSYPIKYTSYGITTAAKVPARKIKIIFNSKQYFRM